MEHTSAGAFGFIGSGNQSNWIRAHAGRRLPGVEWIAYDSNADVAARFARRWGGSPARSLAELADRTGCVMICTPPGARLDALEQYLADRDGRETVALLQKPVATSLEDVEAMRTLLRQHPRARIGVCLDRRPSAWWAAEQIAAGAIGVPYEADFGFTCVGATATLPGWFLNGDISGGGAGIDLFPHPFDVLDTALGRPRFPSVKADRLHRMMPPGVEVEDMLIGTVTFAIDDGEPGVGLFRASWEDKRNEFAVVVGGTHGYLEITRTVHRDSLADDSEREFVADETLKSRIITRERGARNPIEPEGAQLSLADCRANQVAEAMRVLTALNRGEDPATTLPTLDEAARGLRLTLAAYDSARRGETVHDVL